MSAQRAGGLIRSWFLLCLTIVSSPIYAATETVYADYPLGVITVGLDESKLELRRGISLVVSGADSVGKGYQQSVEIATCALPLSPGDTESPGYVLIRGLDALEFQFNPTPDEMKREIARSLNLADDFRSINDASAIRALAAARLDAVKQQLSFASPTPEEMSAAVKAEFEAAQKEILKTLKQVNERLYSCNPNMHLNVGLAIYACTKLDKPCSAPAVANTSLHARRYARLHQWLKTMMGPKERLPKYAILKLSPAEKDPTAITLGEKIEDYLGLVEKLEFDPQEAQKAFERLARYTREIRRTIPSYAIPIEAAEAIGVKREIAVRLADTVSGIDRFAILESDPGATLLLLEDEIARSRIKECYLFKGKISDADLAKCLPYQVAQAEVLECLRPDGKCVPNFKDPKDLSKNLAEISVSLITAPRALKDLVVQELPRMEFKLDDKIAEFAQTCAQGNVSEANQARCILNKYLPEELNSDRLTACVHLPGTATAAIEGMERCLSGAAPNLSADARSAIQMVRCLEDPANSKQDCLLAASVLPGHVQRLVDCQGKPTAEEQVACAAGALNKDAKTGLDVIKCIDGAKGDTLRIAACAGRSGILSSDAGKVLACMSEKSDALGMAACAGGDKLPESVRRPIQCAASSGGNPMGVAICIAGDGLTASQRIALQCAAQSGGEPNTFMVCAGGQMLLKAVVSCSKATFGVSPCFGDGNEFQKLLGALGLPKAGPNSVLGQVINAQIDTIKYTVAFAEDLGHGAENLVENVDRELVRFDRERRRVMDQANNNLVKTPARQLESNIKGLGRVAKKLDPKNW